MIRLMKFAICGALIAATIVPAIAQDDAKKKGREKQPGREDPGVQMIRQAKAAGLDEEAVGKVKQVTEEMRPKFQKQFAKLREALGEDAMKAMDAARTEAQKAGKNRGEVFRASIAVLSDKQKEIQRSWSQEMNELRSELREKLSAAVGAENADKIFPQRGKGKGKGKGKKKAG